ncbi:MAG: ASKHA domain-containing protein [Endomicrobiia bacterium]
MEQFKIKIFPENKEITDVSDENLLYTLISNGVNIYASCGGNGTCGKCKIKILSGKYLSEKTSYLTEEEIKQNIVLACKTKIESDVEIELLKTSQVSGMKILADETMENSISKYSETRFDNIEEIIKKNSWLYSPIVKLKNIKVSQPSLDNPISDLDRVLQTVSVKEKVVLNDLNLIRLLPKILRDNNWELNVVVENLNEQKHILDFVKDDVKTIYGIAVDLGTTTVVCSLIDLVNNKTLCSKTALNQQISFGDDIITRIIYSEKVDGLEMLNQKIIYTVNNLITEIISEIKILLKDVYVIIFSGNTTMTHFLYKVPAENIRREPYVPVITNFPVIKAKELDLIINPSGIVYTLPNVASYVGGDIVAGVVSCGIDDNNEISVLLDLGTNGEIVVGNKEFLVCAACSAGPAFEGVGIKCGMRATSGAIEDIKIFGDKIEFKIIDDIEPLGICGSGLIDIPAELLKNGVIDRSGKFVKEIEVGNKSQKLFQRIRENVDGEKEFVIVYKDETKNISHDIVITESDIMNILRSKGAIFHGLHTMLKYLELDFSDIKKIYISGGFGSYLDITKAKMLGLLPDIEDEKFVISGNTSLLGAKLFLLSEEARKKVNLVSKKMTYLDLSSQPFYMNEYSASLFMPHTDLNLFPNIGRIINTRDKEK